MNPITQQQKIAVFGATGKVGSHFVEQALCAGYQVRACVRNRTKLSQAVTDKIEVFEGDALNSADVERAVADVDVVVSCLGGTGKRPIMYTAYNNIMTAAAKQPKPPRCIMISSIGLGGTSWLIKFMLTLIAGKAPIADFEKADKRIREETGVPFVLVRPYALTDKSGSGRYRATKSKTLPLCGRSPEQTLPRLWLMQWQIPNGMGGQGSRLEERNRWLY